MTPLERARGAIGARFRLHGRTIEHGLDCVGLGALAYGVAVRRGGGQAIWCCFGRGRGSFIWESKARTA